VWVCLGVLGVFGFGGDCPPFIAATVCRELMADLMVPNSTRRKSAHARLTIKAVIANAVILGRVAGIEAAAA